ncbi:hypothetical protein GCM10007908_03320 [Rhizobium albus]|nr:hypothetical protein GCM10007908_03320 [Rhizobium albus]
MAEINNGGAAFPLARSSQYDHDGMSLRAYYAGQAMMGDWASQNDYTGAYPNELPIEHLQDRAHLYLRMADAMIAALNETSEVKP